MNFTTFRDGLMSLIGNISQVLEKGDDFPVFSANHNANIIMFGVSGGTVDNGQPNMLALSVDATSEKPAMQLKLMYLDPDQFKGDPSAEAAAS